MKNIILYGSSEDCCSFRSRLEEMAGLGEIHILGRTGAPSEAEQWPRIPFEELKDRQADYYFLMSLRTERDDRKVLKDQLQIPMEKIIPFTVFSLPDMTLELYESIRRRKITVFSNDCYGGMLSHAFRIENRSPLKNLWLYEHEYLKFLENPEYYLSLRPKLKRMKFKQGPYDRWIFPVLSLGDISIFCNHNRNPFRALREWNYRAGKVNMDDLIVVFITSYKAHEEAFYRLDYPHKYCFTSFPSKHEESICIPPVEGETYALTVQKTISANNGIYSPTKMILGEKNIKL